MVHKEKQETKVLVGVKMTPLNKAIIKSRATLESIDMQEIYDEVINDYMIKKPATSVELAIANKIVEKANAKKEA